MYDAKFKMYKFYNVANMTEVFQNLRNVMLSEGWTVLNYWIGSNGFPNLIFIVPGYPGQNLYYHIYAKNTPNYFLNAQDILIIGGLGYNSSTNQLTNIWHAVDSSNYHYCCNSHTGYVLTFPINCQYIFINQYGIIMSCDINNLQGQWSGNLTTIIQRAVITMFIGTVSLYSPNTQGNFILTPKTFQFIGGSFVEYPLNLYPGNLRIYILNQTKSPSCSIPFTYVFRIYYGDGGYKLVSNTYYSVSNVVYTSAIKFNSYTNKSFLHKPIAFISHSEGGYNYFFPVGEIPIYVTRFYPYFGIGEEVWYGTTRKFVMFPMAHANAEWGYAIEIIP
jgi:hypothetical protein